MSNSINPEEQWRKQKAKLKLLLPQLNDEDFNYDYGKKEVMMTKLQDRLHKSREELNVLLTGL